MDIKTNIPEYAFINQFPTITITGNPNAVISLSLYLGGVLILDKEAYQFDKSGFIYIRYLGDTLERHFYNENYDVRYFKQNAIFNIYHSATETLVKSMDVYFCRTYVSGEKLEPDVVRYMPLSRCREKRTLPGVAEYIPFVATKNTKVLADVCYMFSGVFRKDTVTLYSFGTADTFHSFDVSAATVAKYVNAGERNLLYWDVYLSGHRDNAVRYILDKSSSYSPTVLLFQNCFGGVESFLCRGVCKLGHDSEREKASIGGRTFNAGQTSLLSYTVNTGALTQELCESLIDLLNCRSLMLMKGGDFIPVQIASENVSMPNYRDRLASTEFTYTYSVKNLTIYKYDPSKRIFDYTFDQSFN
jgi:hypothetical protein